MVSVAMKQIRIFWTNICNGFVRRMQQNEEKNFINYCGLLGVAAFISYTVAVVFSPLAYPGYNWMAQGVSGLSASNAPSLRLWNQLSSLYNVCTLVCAMMVFLPQSLLV